MEDRKQRILRAITDDYIQTAEPVGSRTVARKYLPGVSPATIRNEMADLEEQGYLEQPHASAGRIPSDLGYRYYVEVLIPREELPAEPPQAWHEELLGARDPETLITRAGRALSRRVRYSTLVLRPSLRRLVLRHVRYTPVDPEHVLLVVVADPGFVYNRLLRWADAEERAEALERMSTTLSRLLHGVSAEAFTRTLLEQVSDEVPDPRWRDLVVEPLLDLFTENRGAEQVYVEGVPFFLEQPEFKDVEVARQVLDRLQDPDTLMALLMDGDVAGLEVTIGHEQPVPELQRCSVVMAPYGRGDRPMGVIGLIGPTRMDYRRALAAVESVSRVLTEAMTLLPDQT
ncbi:MAG: heat-inducible transcription repressor HrcA [Limnochordaceae bacterium]|nr:heat-inducible transcription repressor HrcA [Limnochordaceae bacterium]